MVGGGKFSSSPTSKLAADLKHLIPTVPASARRRTKNFAYGFVLAFLLCTAFLALSPSSSFNSLFSSPFISRLLPYSNSQIPPQDIRFGSPPNQDLRVGSAPEVAGSAGDGVEVKDQSVVGNGSERNGAGGAQVKNAAVKNAAKAGPANDGVAVKGVGVGVGDTPVKNGTAQVVGSAKNQAKHGNATAEVVGSATDGVLGKNQTKQGKEAGAAEVKNVAPVMSQTDPKSVSPQTVASKKNQTAPAATEKHKGAVGGGDQVLNMKNTSLPARANGGQGREIRIEDMLKCDIFHGNWVKDDSYPLYPEGSCPHIDEPFDCYHNGRPDRGYQKLRWQPTGCNIPRLNGTDMLEKLRGKRLVFVGDSLNRNMWESLVCVLRNSVKDKTKVFEASGRRQFKTEGSYSFIFKDYGCTVEFFRSPFLVQEWEMPDHNGSKKETLRLDIVEKSAFMYKDAYAIIFNTGHWWTHDKTAQGKDYYQEGNHVYSELNVGEAFHKALNTWAKWIDANVNPQKTHVFFRGYSASHFSGGQWNSGGQCHKETEPIKNEKYLSSYPPKMSILEEVIKGMKTHVSYMNITRMTDYRKDAHPSIYEKPNITPEERASAAIQDCSHWCLPGVPDSWNELLYAQLLIKLHGGKH